MLTSQPERFWKALRRSNVQIWVSKYTELNIDYAKIEKLAKTYNIQLFYTSTKKDEANRKLWTKYKIDPQGRQYWVDSFEHCAVRNCVTLKKGKLYTCPTIAHIEHFNKTFNTNMEVTEYDYIDIYKVESNNAILHSMVKPVPFCKYCKPKENETCFWERSKKEISEWI